MSAAPEPRLPADLAACPSARWRFCRPDGTPVAPAPTLPRQDHLDLPEPAAGSRSCPPNWDGTRLGPYALGVIIERLARLDRPSTSASAEAPPEMPG